MWHPVTGWCQRPVGISPPATTGWRVTGSIWWHVASDLPSQGRFFHTCAQDLLLFPVFRSGFTKFWSFAYIHAWWLIVAIKNKTNWQIVSAKIRREATFHFDGLQYEVQRERELGFECISFHWLSMPCLPHSPLQNFAILCNTILYCAIQSAHSPEELQSW